MVPETWSTTDRSFCHFGLLFALLPTNNTKNQNFEKMRKRPGDIIILHKCTKNNDNILYCSWDMTCDRCNFFWGGGYFLPFYPLTAQKLNIFKNWERLLEISSFYTYAPKFMVRWCTVPEIWSIMDGWKNDIWKWVPYLKYI